MEKSLTFWKHSIPLDDSRAALTVVLAICLAGLIMLAFRRPLSKVLGPRIRRRRKHRTML